MKGCRAAEAATRSSALVAAGPSSWPERDRAPVSVSAPISASPSYTPLHLRAPLQRKERDKAVPPPFLSSGRAGHGEASTRRPLLLTTGKPSPSTLSMPTFSNTPLSTLHGSAQDAGLDKGDVEDAEIGAHRGARLEALEVTARLHAHAVTGLTGTARPQL
jgi:hypothetical protein